MKIIDLLNKIANDEEVPKKIKYNDYIYSAKGNAIDNFVDYCSEEDEWCFNHYVRYENLNDEVEILEEKKKIPEKLIPTSLKGIDNLDEKIEIAHIDTISVIETLNQLIDYLKSKGDE